MNGSILHKLLLNHSEQKEFQAGDIIPINVNHVFISDNSATPILDALANFNVAKPKCPTYLGQTYFHYQLEKKYAKVQAKLIKDAEKKNITVMEPFQGHWHHNLLDYKKIKPGNVFIGSDSTINFFSPLNTLSISCGATDIIKTLLTGKLDYLVPQLVNINIEGKFLPQTNAKDLALFLKKHIDDYELKHYSIEFSGSFFEQASQDELHNLAFHHYALNAQSFLFPPVLFRKTNKQTIYPEEKATYNKSVRYNVSKLEPMVKLKQHVYEVSNLEHLIINKIFIGNTIGGTLEDFKFISEVLKDKKISIPCYVTPASSAILKEATNKGYLANVLNAGCTLLTPSTGICHNTNGVVSLKNENILSTGIASLSMSTGKTKANIYTASIKTALATAIKGYLVSFKELL